MSINRHAYRAIEAVVGKNYITDDPADCEGYRSGPGGYESGTGYERIMTRLPGAIVMPRTTEDVQKIVKICGQIRPSFRAVLHRFLRSPVPSSYGRRTDHRYEADAGF